MPNRIIKESICTSDNINSLSLGAEILFYRLIVKADDFGCYHGNVKIIKGSCFPLKADDIKDKQLIEWINELIKAGLIFMYDGDDKKPYLKLVKWDKHQQKRANKPKFPLPKSNDINCNQVITDVNVNENENENENVNVNEPVDIFFESVWELYPKRKGKGQVSKTQKQKLFKIGYDEISRAIERYKKDKAGVDIQFIMYGSTFFNSGYVDYLDSGTEPEKPKPEPAELKYVYREL